MSDLWMGARKRCVVTPVRVRHLLTLCPTLSTQTVQPLASHPGETLWAATGHPLACYGILRTGWRRGTGWMVLDAQAPTVAVTLLRQVRRFLRETVQTYGLQRVDVQVNPCLPDALTLARWLGFSLEARFACYGPAGETMEQYVWLEKERAHGR